MVARLLIDNISEEYLAKIIDEVAILYNNALIAPETNYSHSLVDFIIGCKYTRIYITENITRMDKKSDALSYGWNTTKKTKAPMISSLRAYLNEDPSVIPDKEFWYETEYDLLEDLEKLIMNAASGHHDDILVANSIAYYVSCTFQAKQTFTVKNHREDDKISTDMMKFLNLETSKRGFGNFWKI
jgi:hypothetical protein